MHGSLSFQNFHLIVISFEIAFIVISFPPSPKRLLEIQQQQPIAKQQN